MIRKGVMLLAVTLAVVAMAAAQSEPKLTGKEKRSVTEIETVIQRWAEAVRARDTGTLEKLFADDLVITTYDGTVRDKPGELEVLKPDPRLRTVSVVNEDTKIRVIGNAAIVTSLLKMHFVSGERDSKIAFRYTAVFHKKKSGWQITAIHASQPKPQ